MSGAWKYLSNLLVGRRTVTNSLTTVKVRDFCGFNRVPINSLSVATGGGRHMDSYTIRGDAKGSESKLSLVSRVEWRSLLQPTVLLGGVSSLLQQVATLKVKGRLRRRCKDCYIVLRQQRAYVMCPTHGRHKQMSMKKREKSTWILTHATQSKVRPY